MYQGLSRKRFIYVKNFFKNTYSKLNNFIEIQKKINSNSTFKSKLSQRLGL